MKKIDIKALRRALALNEHLSAIAKATGISKSSAGRIKKRFYEANLSQEEFLKLTDEGLLNLLRPTRHVVLNYVDPDWTSSSSHNNSTAWKCYWKNAPAVDGLRPVYLWA